MENSRRKEKQNPFETTSPARRQRIFEAAIHEFATKGFNAANINIIARAAGVSIGSMYSYFASKEDLFLQVMEYCLQRCNWANGFLRVSMLCRRTSCSGDSAPDIRLRHPSRHGNACLAGILC